MPAVSGKLVIGGKILCPPSSEVFHLSEDQLIPTAVEEASDDEDEDMEELEVTEVEETQPMTATSS